MNDFNVFYAWQSDRDQNSTRNIIQKSLRKAIKNLGTNPTISRAPRLDHDTKNVPGIPGIASTIQMKIDRCGIFLADLTFVSQLSPENRAVKGIPNPNVMLELGYAMKAIGESRIILVMNEFYGSVEHLPFDLQHRRHPITYNLGPNPDTPSKNDVQTKLTRSFAESIESIVQVNPNLGIAPRHNLQIDIAPTRNQNQQLAQIQFLNSSEHPILVDAWFVYCRNTGCESVQTVAGSLPVRLLEHQRAEILIDIIGVDIDLIKSIGLLDAEKRRWHINDEQLSAFKARARESF